MALGLTIDTSQIKRFANSDNTIWVQETDSAGSVVTTTDSVWQCMGTMKGTQIAPAIDEFIDKGDSGKRTVWEETLETIEITTTLMQRDAASRGIPQNADGKYYNIAVAGQTLGTSTECWATWGKIGKNFTYAIGANAQMEGIKISALNQANTLTVTLPTVPFGTATVTIAANALYTQTDI